MFDNKISDWLREQKFILLDDNKCPLHSFDITYSFDSKEVQEAKNVGIKIENNNVIVDVDDFDESEMLYKYCLQTGLKTKIMKSSRGKHFWFKNDKPLSNINQKRNALSIMVDIKSFGKKSQAMVKKDGVWREWLHFDDNESFIPKEFIPIKADFWTKNYLPAINYKDGDGRNDYIFNRIILFQKQFGFNQMETKAILHNINKSFFKVPLFDNEIEAMFKNPDILKNSLTSFYLDAEGKFDHRKLGNYVHDSLNGILKNGKYWIYTNNRYYSEDVRQIKIFLTDTYERIKETQRNEVIYYLNTVTRHKDIIENPYILNCVNGLLDLKTKTLIEHSPTYFDVNPINAIYDENANDPIVDKFLMDISINQESIKQLIEEMIGTLLIKNTMYQKAFILYGTGSNGKSTLLDFIKDMIGIQNSSSLAISDFNNGSNFMTSQLVGKMFNICAELSNSIANDSSSTIKALITGDPITVQFKNKDPFTYENYAKFIFAANELPKTTDITEGFFRRFCIIPFAAVFTEDMRDPELLSKLKTDSAKSTLLNRAISGLERLFKNKKYTSSIEIDKAIISFKKENDPLYIFFELLGLHSENEIEEFGRKLIDTDFDSLYKSFFNAAKFQKVKLLSKAQFKDLILKRYKFLKLETIIETGSLTQIFKRKEILND